MCILFSWKPLIESHFIETFFKGFQNQHEYISKNFPNPSFIMFTYTSLIHTFFFVFFEISTG